MKIFGRKISNALLLLLLFCEGKGDFYCYVDDGIFLSPCPHLIDEAVRDLISVGLKIEDQGFQANYMGST